MDTFLERERERCCLYGLRALPDAGDRRKNGLVTYRVLFVRNVSTLPCPLPLEGLKLERNVGNPTFDQLASWCPCDQELVGNFPGSRPDGKSRRESWRSLSSLFLLHPPAVGSHERREMLSGCCV